MAIAVISVALPGLVFAGSAAGCTCTPTPPAVGLARADAAIVGRLLSVEPRGLARAEYRYRVLRVFRGRDEIRRGETISVLSPRGSAGCALPRHLNRRYGLFLAGGGDYWASGICGVLAPRRLAAAARRPLAGSGAGTSLSCAS